MAEDRTVSAVMLTNWPHRAAWATEAVRSFQRQTWPERELIVVNEGVPLQSLAPGVRVVNTGPRRSLGGQRTEGLRAARGAWLATWDDDDFSLPDRLATQLARAASARAVYVRSDRLWFADATLALRCVARGPFFATALVQRAVALRAGGWHPVDYCEDADFERTLRVRGEPIAVTPDLFYVARRHDRNASLAGGETAARTFARGMAEEPAGARVAMEQALAEARAAELPALLAPVLLPAGPVHRDLP